MRLTLLISLCAALIVSLLLSGCETTSAPSMASSFRPPPKKAHNDKSSESADPIGEIQELPGPPVPISIPLPLIPRKLRGKGGQVIVGFVVEKNGSVSSVHVISTTEAGLNQCVLDAIKKARFRPVVLDGKEVRARAVMPFRFPVYDT